MLDEHAKARCSGKKKSSERKPQREGKNERGRARGSEELQGGGETARERERERGREKQADSGRESACVRISERQTTRVTERENERTKERARMTWYICIHKHMHGKRTTINLRITTLKTKVC